MKIKHTMAAIPLALFLTLMSTYAVDSVNGDENNASFAEFRAQLTRLEDLVKAQDIRIQQLEKENRQMRVSNVKLQFDVDNLKLQNLDLRDEVEKVKVQNQKLSDKNQELSAENQKLQDNVQQLRQDNEKIRTETHELKYTVLQTSKTLQNVNCGTNKNSFSDAKNGCETAKSDHVTRDVTQRADDVNSLQPVVSQLSQEVGEVKSDIQVLKNVDQQHSQAIQHAATSTYTRWGHSDCPDSNTLIYSGVVGGSWWQHSGAASNYLCLSMSPVASDHPFPTYYAYLYGGEYETWESPTHNQDAVCAVCRSPRPNTIMIPGTNRCIPGWTPEYSGFLMAGEYDHIASTEYVCVDSSLEGRSGSDTDNNGVLFYFTVAQCGSLPCHPYVNNTVVTCAVCSQ